MVVLQSLSLVCPSCAVAFNSNLGSGAIFLCATCGEALTLGTDTVAVFDLSALTESTRKGLEKSQQRIRVAARLAAMRRMIASCLSCAPILPEFEAAVIREAQASLLADIVGALERARSPV